MATTWTRERIVALPTSDLKAIVRSTNPNGALWVECMTARTELARRRG